MLYKSDSQKAVEMMHEDPSMFQEVRLSSLNSGNNDDRVYSTT